MTIPQIFFAYFAIAMTVLSLLVVTMKNLVHSVFWMLLLFIHIAALYLFLNAEFLAAIQIIIYAGAILVLFLFVIMLLNLKKNTAESKFQKQWPLSLIIGMLFIIFFALIISQISVLPPLGEYSIDFIKSKGAMMTTGMVLYTKYLLPFEIASLILLVAIIGAIVLAKKRIN